MLIPSSEFQLLKNLLSSAYSCPFASITARYRVPRAVCRMLTCPLDLNCGCHSGTTSTALCQAPLKGSGKKFRCSLGKSSCEVKTRLQMGAGGREGAAVHSVKFMTPRTKGSGRSFRDLRTISTFRFPHTHTTTIQDTFLILGQYDIIILCL